MVNKENIKLKIGQSNLESENNIANTVKKIQDLYFGFAKKYLDEKSLLKKYILAYYSDLEVLNKELSVVFSGLNENEINKKIEKRSKLFENKTYFIEHNQKIFERMETSRREERREINNPLATNEEYELGVYKDGLEIQVRDAVFLLAQKGYKTFQSGFREKSDRDQFIDVYNKNINLPYQLLEYFKEKGFKISVFNQDDRTSVDIHPSTSNPVTLEKWKIIWDDFARKLPVAQPENFDNISIYSAHSDFRRKQDSLRKNKF
ncbi:MAG: hypothetical protein WDK96_00740 [Candidatus Paceibacterota bacterium]|jgi:hypothetical protein